MQASLVKQLGQNGCCHNPRVKQSICSSYNVDGEREVQYPDIDQHYWRCKGEKRQGGSVDVAVGLAISPCTPATGKEKGCPTGDVSDRGLLVVILPNHTLGASVAGHPELDFAAPGMDTGGSALGTACDLFVPLCFCSLVSGPGCCQVQYVSSTPATRLRPSQLLLQSCRQGSLSFQVRQEQMLSTCKRTWTNGCSRDRPVKCRLNVASKRPLIAISVHSCHRHHHL